MNSHAFDMLGAEPVERAPLVARWTRNAIAIGAGIVAGLLYRKHWALAAINTAAAVSNVHAVATGERTSKEALKRMGRHVVAAAGSLALPIAPTLGYVAGAIAGEMLIATDGTGLLDEFKNDYDDLRGKPRGDVIDAEFIEVKPTQALVVKK